MKAIGQGSNGWYATIEQPGKPNQLESDERFDWIVIGAGCCGLSTAHRLAELKPDDRIALVDAERVGYGSSGRNSGFMIDAHVHGLKTDVSRLGKQMDLWRAGLEWLRTMVRNHQIQCQWSEWGRLYVAASPAGLGHLGRLESSFESLGLSSRRLDEHQMRDATGSDFYRAGVHMSGSALVQPAALMRGLADALPPSVVLYENTPVQSLGRAGSQWVAHTVAGSLRAAKVILCAGVDTPSLGFLQDRMVPLSLYASLSRPLTADQMSVFSGIDELGLLPTSAHGSTVRLTRDRRFLMRNTTRYARYKGNLIDDLSDVRDVHSAAIARRWPALANLEIEHTWGGVMAVTRNGGALFGQVAEGAFVVGTSDVSPVTRGTIAGRLMAEHVSGKRSELLDVQLGLASANRVPPDPFLGWLTRWRLGGLAKSESAEL